MKWENFLHFHFHFHFHLHFHFHFLCVIDLMKGNPLGDFSLMNLFFQLVVLVVPVFFQVLSRTQQMTEHQYQHLDRRGIKFNLV